MWRAPNVAQGSIICCLTFVNKLSGLAINHLESGQFVDTWTDTTSLIIPRAFINPGFHSSPVKCIRVWRSPSSVADSALGIVCGTTLEEIPLFDITGPIEL